MVALHGRWLHTRVHRHTMQLLLLTLECTGLAGAAACAHASHAAAAAAMPVFCNLLLSLLFPLPYGHPIGLHELAPVLIRFRRSCSIAELHLSESAHAVLQLSCAQVMEHVVATTKPVLHVHGHLAFPAFSFTLLESSIAACVCGAGHLSLLMFSR